MTKRMKKGGGRGEGVMSREEKVGIWSEGKPKYWEMIGNSFEYQEYLSLNIGIPPSYPLPVFS
jgi:hypothetical protein